MKRNVLLIATLLATVFGSVAQETMYLIKGDQVIAKYPISEVDYAAFELPAGVKDLTGGDNELKQITYLGASAVYFGTEADCGQFQIQFTSKDITDENPPISFLYLQFSTPKVTDPANIKIAEGLYTLGNGNEPASFKFYAGERQVVGIGDEQVGGSLTLDRATNTDLDIKLVSDGQFSIKYDGERNYSVAGLLKLENGNVLDFNYSGPLVVINQSSEQPPADEVPIPESKLTADCTFTPLAPECYGTVWKSFFNDAPQFDYIYILLYDDANYTNCLQLGMVVDRDKYPGVILPKGKYPMISRTDGSLSTVSLATYPAFSVGAEDMAPVDYGCWITQDYSEKSPLVGGEIEVLEDATSLNSVKLRITLKDNAPTPHTVTCTFEGKLDSL